MPDPYLRRHVHQLIHPDVAHDGQQRLRNAAVLVVGADEIGAPALELLARAGVGRLGIVDGNPLQTWEHRPGRGVDVDTADQMSRSTRWAKGLPPAHPGLTTAAYPTRLTPDNAREIIVGYDVVLCAVEDPALCYLVDDACALLAKPFVWGSLDRDRGQAGVFWDRHGPTYRDVFPDPPAPYFRGMAGVLDVLGSWVAATLVGETVKLLTGRGEPLIGRVVEYDLMRARPSVLTMTEHSGTARPAELSAAEPFFGLLSQGAADAAAQSTVSATELRDLIDSGAPLHVVDVREPEEFALVSLPGSTLIPQREFLHGDAADRLPKDRRIVLLCRMGLRSAEVLAVVKAHGHQDAVHLGGGILAWAEQIDPSLPTY